MSIVGKRAKKIQIPAPVGIKIAGKITDLKMSERFGDVVDIMIDLPDYTMKSDDGTKVFVKRVYYSISLNWSPKNKGGRLYKTLYGRLPADNEVVDWEQALKGQEVLVILEDVLDEETGDVKGQKVKWIGAKNPPMVIDDNPYTDDDDLPEDLREPGSEG